MNMRITLLRATVASLLILAAPTAIAMAKVSTVEDDPDVTNTRDSDAKQFVFAPGYKSVNVQKLNDDRYYSPNNFPALGSGPSSAFWPDTNLDPITRAMLFVDTQEPKLPRVRYKVTYSMNALNDERETKQHYVEVTRYNMGPIIHQDVVKSTPAGVPVAPASEFGVGPNIGWRFVMSPIQGMRSGLLYASRKELSDAEAKRADCLGVPCLGFYDPTGPDKGWRTIDAPSLNAPVYNNPKNLGLNQPTRVIEELWASISSEEMDILPYNKKQPQFEFVVSQNTFGQNDSISALVKQFPVMDDSISEVWTRRIEIPNAPVEFSNLYVPRR